MKVILNGAAVLELPYLLFSNQLDLSQWSSDIRYFNFAQLYSSNMSKSGGGGSSKGGSKKGGARGVGSVAVKSRTVKNQTK